ncbi:MAG: hypothetical protein WBF51_09805 [Candidatus Dormiibacterota bacterium]
MLLLANQVTPISGWSCLAIGIGLLAVAMLLDRFQLAQRFAVSRTRAPATAAPTGSVSLAAGGGTPAKVARPRRSARCRGSTDGHHRWSRDQGLCMFCGQEMPEGAG